MEMERLQFSNPEWEGHVLCSVKAPEDMEMGALQLIGTLFPGKYQKREVLGQTVWSLKEEAVLRSLNVNCSILFKIIFL